MYICTEDRGVGKGERVMYAKVFKTMFDGTLRGKSDALLVFVNLLANCDREGFVDRHFRAISEETGIPIDRVTKAISELEGPDPESRSREMQGRRLERLDDHRAWGWKIVNYEKYRDMQRETDRLELNRQRQQRFRERHNEPGSDHSIKREFTDKWCAEYQNFYGNAYHFQGAKDGKAADRLIAIPGMTPTSIMAIAIAAWRNPTGFNSKLAASLAGFESRFNEIRQEVSQVRKPKTSGKIAV